MQGESNIAHKKRKIQFAVYFHVIRIFVAVLCIFFPASLLIDGNTDGKIVDLDLTVKDYVSGEVPSGWSLKKVPGYTTSKVSVEWVKDKNGTVGVRLFSDGALTFLKRKVNIDISRYPIVTWRWKVENILYGNDERMKIGDDHPIRIFFVFDPDIKRQSIWFRFKRLLYLDMIHGHPVGGRFTEYLWSNSLKPGTILPDPSKPRQKLIVIEGGKENLNRWLSYERNLYDDFKRLYGEEPRRLIFIGIINDTDQTNQKAISYIGNLMFHSE